jgi:hypothetical protein
MNTYKAIKLLCETSENDYDIECYGCHYQARLEDGYLVSVFEEKEDPIDSDYLVCEDGQIIQVIECPECGNSLVAKGK